MEKNTNKISEAEIELNRHPDFAWVHKPFGINKQLHNLIWLSYTHLFCGYYLYRLGCGAVPLSTVWFGLLWGYLSGLGITVGCHRYWTHKSFKANKPLQIILMIMQSMAGHGPIYNWCLDHRLHHRYTDTDGDPYNASRGFLFSHFTWQILPQTKEVKERRLTFRMPDLENDPIVRFQCRWYWTLQFIFHLAIPIAVYYYIWELSLIDSIACNYCRFIIEIHFAFSVNSFAHMWGDKPFDKKSTAVENAVVSLITGGEGWHNFHHAFAWDYKASEFGWNLNHSTMFIDFFAWLGWAYDLKTVSTETVIRRKIQNSHNNNKALYSGVKFDKECPDDVIAKIVQNNDHLVWGWDDERMPVELKDITTVLKSKPN